MGAVTAYDHLTLVELAKRKDPKGNLAVIAEVLAEDNEILQDAVWQEANDTFSHKCVRRLTLPSGSWRKLNQGVSKEASRTVEVIEALGMLETYSEVDKKLVSVAPDPKRFRMDEAAAFIEGMSQTFAATLIYGNASTTPESFTGLAPRMASLAATANVIGCGGGGSDLTSIFVVQWGLNKVFMVYPKGSEKLGVSHEDLGEVTLQDASGNNYQGYRDHFQLDCGLVVRDERCVGRICNIESAGSSNLVDEDELIRLLNRMPKSGAGACIYVNSTVKTQMEIRLKDKTNVNFTADKGEGLAGVPLMRFRGCPVRKVDQILITESALT